MKYIIIVLFLFISTSYAGWSEHGVNLNPPNKIKIAILPTVCNVRIKKLKNIKDVSELKIDKEIEEKLIRTELDKVTKEITGYIKDKLNNSYFFEVVPESQTAEALKSLGITTADFSLKPEQIKKLGEISFADAIMTNTLSGYGKIKKKWQVILLGSGFVEGIVFGAEIHLVTKSEELAIAGAIEEIVQEILKFGIGIGVFNKIFTPIILESKLISTKDGKKIWSKTAFTTVDKKTLKKFPEKDRKNKELRLKVTLEKSIETIIKNLNKKASKNIM